jgi:hypothetical protein
MCVHNVFSMSVCTLDPDVKLDRIPLCDPSVNLSRRDDSYDIAYDQARRIVHCALRTLHCTCAGTILGVIKNRCDPEMRVKEKQKIFSDIEMCGKHDGVIKHFIFSL